MTMNLSAKLVSKLGSTNSKIPLAVKDLCNSAGCTYFSYDAGGEIEGKDRLVDEIGTGALWLFGIPAYKKLIDKTIFKKAQISPNVDIKLINNPKQLQKAISNAPTEQIKKELIKVSKNLKKAKNLNILKFGLSLGLTMLSYFGLTKFKQEMTKKNIEKEFLAKNQNKRISNNLSSKSSDIFDEIENPTKKGKQNPSFGCASAVGKIAQDLMLNPVKNMMLLDIGISSERLANSRTKGELVENGIKEGSFLFFVYCADKFIKKGINKISEKLFKTPIDLDANLLSTNYAKEILSDKKLQKEIKEFGEKFAKNVNSNDLYEYILKNQNHAVVEAAKKSGIISTIKDEAGNILIDTRKYIDLDEIKKLTKNLDNLIKLRKPSLQTQTKYLNKIRNFKVASTLLNLGICCISLGYVVPKMMYSYRKKHQNGDNNFHVKAEYEKELAAKHFKS